MNDDTQEVYLWIESEDDYKLALHQHIGNEMAFIVQLYGIILHINSQLTNERKVSMNKVNGNEIYVEFCEEFGNEQNGWGWK